MDLNGFIELSIQANQLYLPHPYIQTIQEAPSPLEFYRNYVSRNIPVLIKRGCTHWPAIKKWSSEYLVKTVKNRVSVAFSRDGADKVYNDTFVLPHTEKMHLGNLENVSHMRYLMLIRSFSLDTNFVMTAYV